MYLWSEKRGSVAVHQKTWPPAPASLRIRSTSTGQVAAGMRSRLRERYGSLPVTRNVRARFLGKEASFPLLGFALSRAAGAPICVGMAFSTGMQSYEFHGIGPINDEITEKLPAREEHSRLAQIFADHLGRHLKRFPLQWFNFYDFWAN